MQQTKSPFGSTRSSGGVLDRVRWIEKTHGSANTNTQPQPRGRLRLPKQFSEPADAEPKSPAATVVGSPSPKFSEGARLSRVEEDATSPVVNEAMASDAKSPVTPATTPVMQEVRPKAALSSDKSAAALSPRKQQPQSYHSMEAPKADFSAQPAPVTKPPMMPTQYGSDDDMELYKHRNSSSSDIEVLDPVRMNGTALADASETDYRSASSLVAAGSKSYKALGGIRSRTRPTRSRRYGKSQANTNGSASVRSNNQSDDEEEQSTRAPPLRSSQSLTNVRADYDGEPEETTSLLSRLASLTANRPKVQDLVSNRSAPKFVKRSHHYNASPFKNDSPAPSFSSTWSRSQKRYK
ncbi:hypothetical protein IWW36_002888 [Coemansia brasiliensis]|uniref:Uncharacterized protein n=1 Tax=Coemansia brasiliensis TaxID=2650707 RepID=A0A9W8I6G0_9FUNG|nr:hypothetical protein IWW36_002888 [Coemansia brasiliensis]